MPFVHPTVEEFSSQIFCNWMILYGQMQYNLIGEEFWLGPADRLGGLVVIAPARRAGDPGSIPGPGSNFSLEFKL